MNTRITLRSPAKINWFLHITGQRENGYHELQTLFQFIDLYDRMTFSLTQLDEITLTGDDAGVAPADNLIYKAASLLKPYRTTNMGVCINTLKQIPMGGGLGGGSSNAATTLLALNQLWQCALSNAQLMSMGLQLGADVPIFIHGKTAFAEGVGETLFDTHIASQFLLIALPEQCHISTQDIFSAPELVRNTAKIDFNQYSFENTHNDCQPIATSRFPLVAKTLQWLLEYAPSRMTGTGACSFALFETQNEACSVAKNAPKDIKTWVVKTLPQSPVLSDLQTLN